MNHVESSLGSARARRKAKAQADKETAHRLWFQRLADIMQARSCTPDQAFEHLRKEVPCPQTPPQRRAQELEAWRAFVAAVERCRAK